MFQNTTADLRADIDSLIEEAPSRNKGFVGLDLLPKHNVPRREGLYPRFTTKDTGLMQARAEQRAPGAAYPRAKRSYSHDRYTCGDWGLEEAIDDTDKADLKRYFDMEVTTAKLLRDEVMRTHESLVAAEIIKPGSPEGATGFHSLDAAAVYSEGNLANIDFPRDLQAVIEYMEGTGYVPNTIVMTRATLNLITRSPKMVNFFYPVAAGQGEVRPISLNDIQSKFGVDKICIGTARIDRSKKRGVVDRQKVWSDGYIFFGDIQGGDFQSGGVGRTLSWDEFSGSRLFNSMSYREEQTKSDILRCSAYFGLHITDYFSGVLLNLNP